MPTSASRWRCTTTRRCGRWRSASPACRSSPTACRRSSTRKVKVDPRRDRAGRRLPDRGRLPDVRQQRQPRRSAGGVAGVSTFMSKLRKYPTYRNALHTQSVLTITSNVVYGKSTGNTPDGRRKGEPFAPGANPMHGRDSHGIHASAASVAKIPYRDAADGISLTTTLVPTGLGRTPEDRVDNLTGDARRVLRQHRLSHERERPQPRRRCSTRWTIRRNIRSLTIRVSGYAVNFVRLTREQQMDVINRTFHGRRPPCVSTVARCSALVVAACWPRLRGRRRRAEAHRHAAGREAGRQLQPGRPHRRHALRVRPGRRRQGRQDPGDASRPR